MNKKVLITGSGGFVGRHIYHALEDTHTLLGIGRTKKERVDKQIDVTDRESVFCILEEFQPDEIVHLAALSNVEACEREKDLAYIQNVVPIEILTGWSRGHNTRIVFVSTDYVYDGEKGDFVEEDAVHPIQYYGKTKVMGEELVSSLERYAILRPTVIYGWDPVGMNFFMQLYRKHVVKQQMNVPIDQVSNPTYVHDLSRLIKHVLDQPEKSGIFNTTGNESMSRYEFGTKICEYMEWDKSLLVPVETQHLGQLAKRPLHNSTSNTFTSETFDFQFSTLEESFEDIKNHMKHHI